MIDPTGALITELRTAGIASGRVRGGEPAKGDALAPGSFQRFVVLSRLGGLRWHRAPLQQVFIGFRAYGVTYADAAALYGELSDAVDNAGVRIVGHTGIYNSLDEVGGTAGKDPDTSQPYMEGTIALYASTQAQA